MIVLICLDGWFDVEFDEFDVLVEVLWLWDDVGIGIVGLVWVMFWLFEVEIENEEMFVGLLWRLEFLL